MSFTIEFQKKETYQSLDAGIAINVTLRYGNREQPCPAKVDTGAEFCLFNRTLTDALEIDVESGFRQKFSTLGGGIFAYGHEVELETLGLSFQSYVYFAEGYEIKRNLLGRQGWLQLVKIGLDDYKSELYLSPNDE